MTDTPFRYRVRSLASALALLGGALAGCIATPEASAEGALYVKDALTDEVAAGMLAQSTPPLLTTEVDGAPAVIATSGSEGAYLSWTNVIAESVASP